MFGYKVGEWQPVGKELFTRCTVCSFGIVSVCGSTCITNCVRRTEFWFQLYQFVIIAYFIFTFGGFSWSVI